MEQNKKKVDIKRLCALALCLTIMLSLFVTTAYAESSEYPSVSNNSIGTGDESVTLTKEASWNNDHNKAAVELTFDGFEKVFAESQAVDVLLVVDNSDSMWHNCLNENHKTYCGFALKETSRKIVQVFADETNPGDWESYVTNTTNIRAWITDAIATQLIPDENGAIDYNLRIPVPDMSDPTKPSKYFLAPSNSITSYTPSVDVKYDWMIVNSETEYVYNRNDDYFFEHYHVSIDKETNAETRILEKNENNTLTGQRTNKLLEEQKEDSCVFNGTLLRTALQDFGKSILAGNSDSRVALAVFSEAARSRINSRFPSQNNKDGYIDFTSNTSAFEQALNDILFLRAVGGHTNYEAAMLSGKAILNGDSEIQNQNYDRQLVTIFFTDGWPNRFCTWPAGVTLENATTEQILEVMKTSNSTGMVPGYNESAFLAGLAVMKDMQSDYPDMDVYTASHSITMNEGRLSQFTTASDDTNSYQTEDYSSAANAFSAMYSNLENDILKKTKVVTITDLIDNRYFTVDEAALAANDSNKFYPDYVTAGVESVIVDGVASQKVSFTYTLAADQRDVESVKIPLLLNADADASATNGYVPTNYDPSGTNGASATYIDLDGNRQTITTKRVWLPTGGVRVIKVDASNFATKLNGAGFRLYYADGTQYSDTVYTTDGSGTDAGTFIRHTLPPVEMYLVEVSAPSAYTLPTGNAARTDFTVATTNGVPSTVELTVTNIKTPDPTPTPDPDPTPVDPKPTPNPNAPDTGDNNNLALWIALFFAAVGGIATIAVIEHRRRNTPKEEQ